MFSTILCVVRPFIHLLLDLWTRYFESEWSDSDANWHKWSTRNGRETINFGSQEVKGQDHTRPKVDLEASFSTSLGRVGFLVRLKAPMQVSK